MTAVLHAGQQGTPLLVIASSDYSAWLEKEDKLTQSWLTSLHYQGKGLQPLFNTEDGHVSRYLVGVEDLNDYFALGNLATSLPSGDYYLANIDQPEQLAKLAFGFALGAYQFDRYKKAEKEKPHLYLADTDTLRTAKHWVTATTLVRDLINTPAGDMMPSQLAATATAIASECGAKVSQIVGDELLIQNYPMIHAVGRASVHHPRLIDIRWGNANNPKVTLVGKGICFDSGGLDLKPSSGMRTMKKDMGGSAHVLGLAYLIMSNQLPINLRVLIPAAENAVSGNAFRPGDVLKTRKGLTVEIENTDAEGRLVLCDALTEAVSEQPELVIDFATLTGACRIALGTELPGFFTNDKALAQELMSIGDNNNDPVWQLPLHQAYRSNLDSDVADLANAASDGYGGAITAALYLERFVENTPWVHFDIMAWNRRKLAGRPVGGEAMGMRTVFEYLQKRFA